MSPFWRKQARGPSTLSGCEYVASSRALGAAYRDVMGRHYPAMTAVEVKALIEERARVEIEATAVIPDGKAPAP